MAWNLRVIAVMNQVFEVDQKLKRLRRVQEELLTRHRKIVKIGITGNFEGLGGIELLESHGPIGKLTLGMFLLKNNNQTVMPGIRSNSVQEGKYRFF